MPVPILSHSDIAARAADVLRAHNVGDAIPVDVEAILDVDYGLEIYPRSGLMDRFQIDAFISADLTEIVVDQRIYEQRPPNRYRFSLAHEFAHLVLHAEVYRSLAFRTPDEWKAAMAGIAADQYDWLEWQANTFAGLLFVPPAHLREQADVIQAKIIAAGLDPFHLDEPVIDRVIRMLGLAFAVSPGVIERRLRKDQVWPLA